MKLRYEFIITDMGGEFDAVPVGDNASEFHGMLRLDETAADVLGMIKDDITPNELLEKLVEKYPDTPRDDIGNRLAGFMNKLIGEGILIME